MACDKSAKCYPGHVVQIQTSVLCRVILYTKNDASAKKYTLAGLLACTQLLSHVSLRLCQLDSLFVGLRVSPRKLLELFVPA